MAKTKRDLAGELVGAFGRFMPDAPNLKYYVRLLGRSSHAAETDELADLVTERYTMKQLRELVKTIPEEDDGEAV